MKDMKGRIAYLDNLKGFLILLVIIGHFDHADYNTTIVKSVIYSFHMPLFIFLSGIVVDSLSLSKLKKRLWKLMAPFAIVGSFYAYLIGDISTWLFTDTKDYFWYILVLSYCLIITYMIHYAIEKVALLNKKKDMSLALGGGIILIAFFAINIIIPQDIKNLLSVYDLCVYFPFYYFGHLCRKISIAKKFVENNVVYTICLIFYVVFQYMYMTTSKNYYHAVSALSAIIVLMHAFKNVKLGKVENALSYLGRNSMGIYLYHGFVLFIFNLSFLSVWVNETSNYGFEIVISFIIAIIIAVFSMIIDRIVKESKLLCYILYGEKRD